ncbi:MAG TPA: MATE family efflux transporter [Prolixibacteraceae bacterium]
MIETKNLTEGSIPRQLIRLSLPIMGTSFIQMAYNLINMIWLGQVGSDSVAAVGVASFFTWLGVSIMLIARIGTEIGVSQSLGSNDHVKARQFAGNAVTIVVLLSIAYGLFTYLLAPQLISFFNIKNSLVSGAATSYLRIIAIGSILYYSNPTFSGIFNGAGVSKLPFRLNATGLICNLILDPFLIFGIGPFPKMGSDGAAIATIISQGVVSLLFIIKFKNTNGLMQQKWIVGRLNWPYVRKIFSLGTPVAIHSILFASFGIILARIIGKYGALPIAVQSIGAQIEALSWMTAGGFATALGVFTGQNFGAGNWNRIFKGFWVTIAISGSIGIIVTFCFIFFGRSIFSVFLSEPEAIAMGIQYLKILGLSQLFMCLEIPTGGAFNGIGRTYPPSIVGISLTAARIPLALFLSQESMLGMSGVWWSISISSILKGIVLFSWFNFLIRRHPEKKLAPLKQINLITPLPIIIHLETSDIKKVP